MDTMIRSDVRHEMLRIAGKKVETKARLEVRFPWDNRAGRQRAPRHARAGGRGLPHRPRLQAQADALSAPADPAQDGRAAGRAQGGAVAPDHAGVGALPEGLALRGRPRLRRLHLRRPALPARRRPDLLLRSHPARQAAQDLHPAPAAQRHLGDHAVQPSAEHGGAQAGAGLRHQQLRGAEADRADAAHRAVPGRHALRGGPAARDAVGHHRQSVGHRRRHDHRSRMPTS